MEKSDRGKQYYDKLLEKNFTKFFIKKIYNSSKKSFKKLTKIKIIKLKKTKDNKNKNNKEKKKRKRISIGLFNNVRKLSLKQQLMIVFILISIVPVTLLGFVTYNKVYSQVSKVQKNMLSAHALGVKNNIDTTISSAENVFKSLSAQTDMLVLLEDIHNDNKLDNIISLNKVLLSLKNAVNSSDGLYETIFITNVKGNVIGDGSRYKEVYENINISNTDYYKKLKVDEKGVVIGKPIISKATGRYVIPVAKPIDSLSDRLGIMVIMFDLEEFTKPFKEVKIGKTGYIYIVNEKGTIVYHKEKDKLLTKIENSLINNAIIEIKKVKRIYRALVFIHMIA
ncbi:cache domain-containing protein [Thermohalobacter berrensis]|uniref:Cache domain-containing protein n=1 Tax=Thermohalobacter berrensis TaxID=99594 RepID=A0A419TA26_9FIRM|nr:cache domain-containing protein [Thermohalobacter berrensis]RKD34315.1 hypothetical protein BET03_00335 [Thermohalobacter berrensis]